MGLNESLGDALLHEQKMNMGQASPIARNHHLDINNPLNFSMDSGRPISVNRPAKAS